MLRKNLFFWWVTLSCATATAQDLTDILTGVDTLFIPGAVPGHLAPDGPAVTPLVSNSPCETPRLHYAVATEYQAGRVVAIAHEGLLVDGNIDVADNLVFVTQAIGWLGPGPRRVALKPGWVNNGNSSMLQNALTATGYTFSLVNGKLSSTALAGVDILILGNDWNGVQPYLPSELAALEAFVAEGGALFIAGLGWSWPQSLDRYPMNAAANLFGFAFTTDFISDAAHNVDGSPKLYHFFPENLAPATGAYCPAPFVGTNIARGETLRVFRLAVSTNGEFTQAGGGVDATAQALTEWLEEINTIYGREYCVRFELIPDNDRLIFPDPATDPWGTLPAGSGGCTNASIILNDQAAVIDGIIGADNYDISHVIAGSPFGGGCAGGLRSGLSGGLDIPVTRHEIGHQLAQSHTINNSGNNNYEPENGGWTIQGGNARGYGHAVSFHQLADFLLNAIPGVGEKIPTGNTIPTVSAGPDYVIPVGTPFTLTGTASDPDANDRLTYVWDNLNRGIAQTLPVADDAQGALFMRLRPDTSASRTFPRMSDVIANNNANAQEQLPSQPRIMDIRLTVNDNHRITYAGESVNASGIDSDDVQLTVADAGPFVVTSQSTAGISYPGGSEQLVTWAVNGTDSPPVSTQQVSIQLSTDGGYTYPYVLAASTPNDGSAPVTLPNIATATARIKVAAVDNIYFDLNARDFTIQQTSAAAEYALSEATVQIAPNPAAGGCQILLPAGLSYRLSLFDRAGNRLAVPTNRDTLDVSGLPAGVYLLEVTDLDTDRRVVKRLVVN